MTRRIRLGSLIVAALVAAAPAGGQFPGQNIPPTRVPLQSDEPPLADKSKAAELPDKVKQSIIGAAPAGGTAVTPMGPTAPVSLDPPTPVVSLHLVAPASISAGADVEYKIVVENKSQAAAHHVRVSYTLPEGTQLVRAEPPEANEKTAGMLAWRIGTLKPGEKNTIRVVILPKKDGLESLEGTARVQFEHGQKVLTILHRPKIEIRKVANRHALVNEPIACKLMIKNTGAVEVNKIFVHELLKEGLVFPGKDPSKPMVSEWKIDSLPPNQTREFSYSVIATKEGGLSSEIEARAERGVFVKENWNVSVGPSPLSVKITGPKEIYLNYPARYDVDLEYKGTAPLENVVVAVGLQKGMKVVRSTPGSQGFENRLQWKVPRLAGGAKQSFSVWAQASSAGVVPVFAEALWHGPRQVAEMKTDFRGAAALHVDIRESADPVRVGEKVRYTLTVTNRGTAVAKDVRLVVEYPVMHFDLDVDGSDGARSTTSPGVQVIGPLTIEPKGTLSKVITLKARKGGKANFHVEMESAEHLPSGNVTREEPTTITD